MLVDNKYRDAQRGSARVVIEEEFLEGREASAFGVLCDGKC